MPTLAPIAALLRRTVTGLPFGKQEPEHDFRISIAGAQEKTALLRHQGQWMRPQGATPTTHIIKLPLGLVGNMQADMRTSVYNEWLCLKLMAALGFDVAQADIVTFADHPPVLVVERFDRKLHPSGQWIVRLPQEDFCQARGVNPAIKYEADGGPGIEQLAQVLHGSQDARADLRTLLASQITFWLMAATDFSFYLAIPTLIGAGAYSLYKERALLSMADAPMFGVGLVVSFISAWLCIKWLLKFIATHSFVGFAYYRIVFGVIVLLTAWTGWVQWAA